LKPYVKQYKWSNIFAMMRNLQLEPIICTDDFSRRLVVITGASSGIGYATARKFASHGADLLFINRSEQKSEELCEELERDFNTKSDYILADFSKLADIHSAARKLSSLERNMDVLIHNAGSYISDKTFTEDKIETVFQTNYLSTFILTYILREKLKNQPNGRILYVNSEAYRFAVFGLHLDDLSWNHHRYSGLQSYGAAKLAQLLSIIKFNDYFKGGGITLNAMHPGNVKTNSGQNNGRFYKFIKKLLIDKGARIPDISAEALYYLGVSSNLEGISGKFFNLTTEEEVAPPALDRDAADKLWEISLNLGGL